MEILTRSTEQKMYHGKRYTRWAIVRNSYPELKTTTLKTWGDWCPPEYGKLTMSSPIRHYVQTPELDMEILFLALDRAEDVKKLLSLELTGAWFNEVREIPKTIVDAMTGRVGRYPSVAMGGCSWSGMIMDTNPPDDQSWWYDIAENSTYEENLKDGWEFFDQPPGDGPDAENIPNLPKGYYKRISAKKDPDWVKVYVKGEYGFIIDGKPVFPTFRDRIHSSPTVLAPVPNVPLLLGADFGLTPAAAIMQKLYDGRWLVIDEYCTDATGVRSFAENLSIYLQTNYADCEISGGWGDPAGKDGGYENKTAFDLLNEYCPLSRLDPTIKWKEAPSNDPVMRLEAVRIALDRLVDGEPGILVSPKAKMIRKGFATGYHYKYLRSGDGTQTQELPNKNRFSHPMDAVQYCMLGGGEHLVVLRKVERGHHLKQNKIVIAKDVDYDLFGY